MKLPLALAALCASAAAADPAWQFRAGDVLTYDASTVQEWRLIHPGDPPAVQPVSRQRQEENVTLRLEILTVDESGNAHVAGTFPAVHVKNTSPAGVAEWDSAKDKTTEFLGFKRYEALLTLRFTATISPDGVVLESEKTTTPDPAPTPNTAREHIEAAALDMHHPTTPRAWLDIIFRATPPARNEPRRTVRFIEEESVEARFARNEEKDGRACAKLTFDTPDRKMSIPPEDHLACTEGDPNAMAWTAVKVGRKKGEAWFDRRAGRLWRLEAASDVTLGWATFATTARMTWNVRLVTGR